MTSEVKVQLKSVQKSGDVADVNRTETNGRLTVSSDQRFMLRFDTSDENGVTSTTIKSKDSDHITVTRTGITQTKMEFSADSPTPFIYRTPIGTLEFMLKTTEISIIADQAPSLSLVMRYSLFNAGTCVSENSIELSAI
ncbi:MAG: DUF1934 domain-containing protein [Lachnospiraceae bacterium]|nr:DUF1934 domain-containing protein [Lachnospiraceae bacterium]